MKLKRTPSGFVIKGFANSGIVAIGWYNGKHIKGYRNDNSDPMGYRIAIGNEIFYI